MRSSAVLARAETVGVPRGESFFSEMGAFVLDAMQAQAGEQRRLVCFAAGLGSRDYSYFIPGSALTLQFLAAVANCAAASRDAGNRYIQGPIVCWQGQEDFSNRVTLEERVQRILLMQNYMDYQCRAIAEQHEPVQFIMLGPDRGYGDWRPCEVALATVEAARRAPDRIVLASAGYEHSGAGHPSNEGYRTAGIPIGQAVVEGVLGGGWQPFFITRWEQRGPKTFRAYPQVQYGRKIVIDDGMGQVAGNGLEASKGWAVRDGDQTVNKTIASVTVVNTGFAEGVEKAFEVTTVEDIDFNTFNAFYAMQPSGGAGDTTATKARGLIRDDTPTVTLADIAYPVGRRWLAPAHLHAHSHS